LVRQRLVQTPAIVEQLYDEGFQVVINKRSFKKIVMRNECANNKVVIFLGESAAKSRTKPGRCA